MGEGIFDLLFAFPKVRKSQKQFADDRTDKLNRSTTVILFLTAAAFIFSRSFGTTISCLPEGITTTPVDLKYVESMCYAQGTLKLNSFFSSPIASKTVATVSYSYPWMSLIAVLIALFFYVPYLIWKSMVRNNAYQHIPIDINAVVTALRETSSLDQKSASFADKMQTIAAYLDRSFALNNFQDGYLDEYDEFDVKSEHGPFLQRPKSYRDRINRRRFRIFYTPLILKYLFVKLIYLVVSIAVFPIMDILFGFRDLHFYEFGYQLTTRIFNIGPHANNTNHSEYVTSMYFPRQVMCGLSIHGDAHSIHQYWFQCGLPANVFNEIVFLVLWYWLLLLVVLNVLSLLKWTFVIIRRRLMIKDILLWPFRYNYHIDKYVDSFVYEYLSTEGFLVIMLIKSNTKDWYCRLLIRLLWKMFMNRTGSTCESIDTEQESLPIKEMSPDNKVCLMPDSPSMKPQSRQSRKECKNNFKSPEQEVKNISFKGEMV